VNVHESVLSRKLVFWRSNCKHVIKYDLYVKFPRTFAHNVQISAKFGCKNFTDVCPIYFGAFFRGHIVVVIFKAESFTYCSRQQWHILVC